nr:ubiquitin-conjugating enzyme family protein [Tanacetum cinerariifolium]
MDPKTDLSKDSILFVDFVRVRVDCQLGGLGLGNMMWERDRAHGGVNGNVTVRVRRRMDLLTAVIIGAEAYVKGVQVGSLMSGGIQNVDKGQESYWYKFKTDVVSYIKVLIAAFKSIVAKEVEEFLFKYQASPPDSELVSTEVIEIVILEVGGIDDDIPLTIKDDNLRDKLLNVNLLIATIEALNDNPTLPSDCKTKSSSTSLDSLLEETSTFHNSLPEFENFYFDLGEISSGSTTTHCDISLLDYEAFYFDDDRIKEISSGSTTTHSDISLSVILSK